MPSWKKGALHTHTLWSDGASLPEMALQTYRNLGYDFVCLSDHNVFQEDPQVWMAVENDEGAWPRRPTWREVERTRAAVKTPPVEKSLAFRSWVRLKTYAELKREFEVPGEFLVIGGEEISVIDQPVPDGGRLNIHLNIFNLEETLPPLVGVDGAATIRLNSEAAGEAERRSGRPFFRMLNHPFWRVWDVDPRDLIANPGIRHFEVCNNGSEETIPAGVHSVEQFWDIVLAHRIEDEGGILYGAAGDDAHFYDPERINGPAGCNLGWVMVRCPGEFTADTVTEALNRGDYYPTTGVLLEEVDFDPAAKTLKVRARREEGVRYRIDFITTRRGFDRRVVEKEYPNPDKPELFRRLPAYSAEIGRVAASVEGAEGSYAMTAEDLYVRAVVVSDRPSRLRLAFYPETERAWTQPYIRMKG